MVCQCDQMLGEELWKIWNLKGKRLNPGKFFVIITGSCGPSVSVEKYDKKSLQRFSKYSRDGQM